MKMTKKISSLIAALLLTTTFNSNSMEPEQPSRWAVIVGGVLLGAAAIKMLWQSADESFQFTALPKEIQNEIIKLLSLETTASTLKEAAFTINSLAQVNHELNELINNSEFCLKLIKHLAAKFNCSDQEAAEALQTKAAKQRLELQNQFLLCVAPKDFDENERGSNDKINYGKGRELYKQGVNLSFTYHTKKGPLTVLDIAIRRHIFRTVMHVTTYSPIINQINSEGNTLLLLCINEIKKIDSIQAYSSCMGIIKFLLKFGPNPELANFAGITPLQLAQEIGYQELIDLIQDAIAKKHAQQ